jgi:hypothetical protein
MGVQHTFGTAGATGGGWSHYSATLQPSYEERLHEPRWQWQSRGPKTWRDQNNWSGLGFTFFRCSSGDPTDVTGFEHQDLEDSGAYEPFICDGAGTQTKRFFRGTCVNNLDVPVANAIVQGFITSTDVYIGEVTANTDGTYVLGTETIAGVAHYLVAYKAGSPDVAGTTVNTLTSTNVDGT